MGKDNVEKNLELEQLSNLSSSTGMKQNTKEHNCIGKTT